MFLTVTDHFVFKHQYNDKLRSIQLQMHNNVTQKLYITYVHATKLFTVKGKAVPLQAQRDPEGFKKLRFPDGGKVVSLTHRPPLPPGNTPGTHFC